MWKILWIFDNYLGDIGDIKQHHLIEVGLVFPSHEWVPGKWGLVISTVTTWPRHHAAEQDHELPLLVALCILI